MTGDLVYAARREFTHGASMRRSALGVAAFALLALGVGPCQPDVKEPPAHAASALPLVEGLDRPVSFEADVKPVLDNRCVVCHACYDAPCQLLLSSFSGAARGATKQPVYDSSRLVAMPPTRLYIDERTTAGWRKRGFFSVLETDPLLLRMLALGKGHPFAPGKRLPDSVGLDIDRRLTCAEGDEFADYARNHPLGGMPYGVAPLAEEELAVLAAWVAQGTPAPPAAETPPGVDAQVKIWEAFLNGESLKERLVGRYLYEHWFVADLYFENLPDSPFLHVVRSRTPPGQPIDEIASVRPYDDPGAKFWYRLEPSRSTVVHKTHIVYALGPKRLARLTELFVTPKWQATQLPGYAPEEASNPFVTFAEIPARSRYQYMLDDAEYFVMTFIRGPVCRGQVAVDVIEDQFFVSFLDPDHDLSITDPRFLAQTKTLLSLPAENRDLYLPGDLYLDFARKQHKYLAAREAFYEAADPKHRGPTLDAIWDGDGSNTNALLTVFRNFDNATVVRGFLGGMPKTAWVMDYPIFERIYYDLVAGFDIYGNVVHQVSTRLYMDHLRMQSENLFLSFLPADDREALRASWYVGATRQVDYFFADKLHGLDRGTQIRFSGKDPKAQLLDRIESRSPAVAGPPDLLNRCPKLPCLRPDSSAAERAVEPALERLSGVKGPWVSRMPEVSLLRVRVDASGAHDLVYALVHNDAHTNVAFMFGEDDRRIPADDTLTVVRGHFGSYPNFFFEVDSAQAGELVDALLGVSSDEGLERVVDRFGIRRTDPRFWATSDWLREDFRRRDPIASGIYDLDRFKNL
jgi:hypothetical protein